MSAGCLALPRFIGLVEKNHLPISDSCDRERSTVLSVSKMYLNVLYLHRVDVLPGSHLAACVVHGGRSSRCGQRRRSSNILEGDVHMCEVDELQGSEMQKKSAEHMTYSCDNCNRGPTFSQCFRESTQPKGRLRNDENDPSVDEDDKQLDKREV